MTQLQDRKFLRLISQAEVAQNSTKVMDMQSYLRDFGLNFNTLVITNTSAASDLDVYLDGQKVAYVLKNNGSFSFDWRDGLVYNELKLGEASNVGAIAADTIKITIGRTGY